MSRLQDDYTLAPGRIRATLVVSCATCSAVIPAETPSRRTAGEMARQQGWQYQRNSGGWCCANCYSQHPSEARDRQRRELEEWRAVRRAEFGRTWEGKVVTHEREAN